MTVNLIVIQVIWQMTVFPTTVYVEDFSDSIEVIINLVTWKFIDVLGTRDRVPTN